jgi:hypothetical protein
MNPSKENITQASRQIGLTDVQADNLWQALLTNQTNKPKSRLSSFLLYFGSLIAITAMTWEYTSSLSSSKSLILSLFYALIFFGTGIYFWTAKKIKIPGGMLCSLGIVMIPLIVYSLQSVMNWWPKTFYSAYDHFYYGVNGGWLPMEICTLIVACVVLYFIRFPFITVLIYSVIWFLSMDTIHFFIGKKQEFSMRYSAVSITIGALLTILAFVLYRKKQTDFGFWAYLFGMLLCWSGLATWDKQTELEHFIFCLINCAFLLLSDFFHRKIFMVFGSLGVMVYIGHLAYVFSDSLHFSYLLGAAGFISILLATLLLSLRKSCQKATPH